ncbi:acetyltransferase family [Radiomyces spectabilis]|uniref:acetyltransferase family n=1 Tax=Radiomyces spectabilis TaxID=64574 RepID=UPI00221F8A2C|nr:acetyltransferase family [Radiomyces spectabilis]KAI8384798.1 acetyltransferase family [Radiomyces spectabilis]
MVSAVTVQYTNPRVRVVRNEKDKQFCFDVRMTVFVDEQKYDAAIEIDERDPLSTHWLLTCDRHDGSTVTEVPVGTVRLFPLPQGVGKLGRLAVVKEARGLALGRLLVETVKQHGRETGLKAIVLHAQVDKRGFYEKLGFTVDAEDEAGFMEEGTPHVRMWNRSL